MRNDKGQTVFELIAPARREVVAGRRVALAGPVENRLVPGRYSLDLYIRENAEEDGMTVQGLRLLHFVVSGTTETHGVVSVVADVEPVLEEPARVSDAPAVLRDVPGPSALGGGWRRALELLYLIAALDFKRHYFGTALGYVWSIARPLMLFGVLLAVFTQVFRLGLRGPALPGAAAVQHRAVRLLPGGDRHRRHLDRRRRRGSCARRSSRAW